MNHLGDVCAFHASLFSRPFYSCLISFLFVCDLCPGLNYDISAYALYPDWSLAHAPFLGLISALSAHALYPGLYCALSAHALYPGLGSALSAHARYGSTLAACAHYPDLD